MTSPARKGGRAGTLLTGAVLALPVCLCAAWFLWSRAPLGLLETKTLRGYALLLGVALLAAGVNAIATRRVVAGGMAIGALLLLAGALAAAHYRFHGWLSLGDGEPGGSYARVARGPGGSPPRVAVTYAGVGEDGRHTLTVAGRSSRVAEGLWVLRRGIAVRLAEAHVAPAFTLAQENGSVEDQLLVKLSPSDPPGQSFQMSVLPYRFFATVEKPLSGLPSPAGPGRIRLRVTRGKLTIAQGTIAPGEALAFEGSRLSWREGSSWAALEVWSVPAWVYLPLLAGLALLLVGAWRSVLAERTAETEEAPADPARIGNRDDD